MLEFLFNKVAGLKVSNSIKKRLQRRPFLVKFEKFLSTPFYRTVSVATSEVYLGFSKESRTKTSATVRNKYHLQLQKKINCCSKNSEVANVGVKRRSATLLSERGLSIAKFLRTLLLKINISVTNLEAVVRRCSVKKLFLEISQNLHESNCTSLSFLI